jgi:hypothetical protein
MPNKGKQRGDEFGKYIGFLDRSLRLHCFCVQKFSHSKWNFLQTGLYDQ